MAPPTRRSQTRRSTRSPSSMQEKKPAIETLLMKPDEEERFQFSFQDEGLTVGQCSQKMGSFNTKEEFLAQIPAEEAPRFLTKALLGQPGRPLQCFSCEKEYASSTGFWNHIRKCGMTAADAAEEYKSMPYLWLKVPAKDQEETLKSIVGNEYACFSPGCKKSFKTSQGLIKHLNSCIVPAYFSFNGRVEEFRKLENKIKQKFARDAMRDNETLKCLVSDCEQEYGNANALVYHVDRCGVEKSAQPWRCYRCGYEGTGAESEGHLIECAKKAEIEKEAKVNAVFLSLHTDSDPTSSISAITALSAKRRRVAGGTPRVTNRKDGSTLFRFRKSTVNREFNGIVTKDDQKSYEQCCTSVYENWKTESDLVPFCSSLKKIQASSWEPSTLKKRDKFYKIFTRRSVTIRTEKAEGLQSSVPSGVQIESLKSSVLNVDKPDMKTLTVAYCGAPINGVKVAPGKTIDGDDVVCVTTFANETDLESSSSVVQFWRHRVENEKSSMNLWFLLSIPNQGTIISMTWLQKNDTTEPGLIGFVAFSTTQGKVLIYRIDATSAPYPCNSNVSVFNTEPHLTLCLPKSQNNSEDTFLNATIKIEGDDFVLPAQIDESKVPLLKIAWSGQHGGNVLAALTALGSIAVWNLEEDLENPRVYLCPEWHSPPTDIAFLDSENIVVGFREKIVRVMNIDTWEVRLEENTSKTAGTRVHTDPRIVHSFFTFNSEYMSFPYSNATSISYVHMDIDSMNLILIPTGNTHQLMLWDAAMSAPLGTLVTCGIDGRLIASASGRLLRNIHHPFFAHRNIMSLKRRRVQKDVQTMEDFLKSPKSEDVPSTSASNGKAKVPLDESLVEHNQVCEKMWLELEFDKLFEPNRAELSCRDQRIESLNVVDVTTDPDWPVAFTGGEAGLLFAVSSKLVVNDVKI